MLKNDTNEFQFNGLFKFVIAFMIFSFFMVIMASRAYAGFTLKYDLNEYGVYNVPYFSFEHWPEWVDAGGYLEVIFIPEGGGKRVVLRIEASQGKFYPQYNGTWTFKPKLPNGDQAGSTEQFQFLIEGQEEYDGSFDKYQDLDPHNPDHWKDNNASPINNDKNYNKPNPTNSNPPSSGGGNGGNGDNGGGNGGDGGSGGSGGNGGSGGGCSCFQTEEWQDLMDILNGIRNRIPSPPNWQSVANTMRDTIVPPLTSSLTNSLTNSFRDMLGTAPSPPSAPATLDVTPPSTPAQPPVHDYAGELDSNAPTFNDVPGLDEASSFTADDIKSEAPEIQFREDESGGFNITNPLESIPKLPYDGFPMPGQNAGPWDHQPQQSTNYTPPTGGGGTNYQPPTTGGGTNYQPPTPGGGTNFQPPIPGSGNVQPPTPDHDDKGWGYYKPHPNAPDGSGGGW